MLQNDDMNDLQSPCYDHQEMFARGFCIPPVLKFVTRAAV